MKRMNIEFEVIDQLYQIFSLADVDKSHSISRQEFFHFFKFPDTPFAHRIFGVFDKGGSDAITFQTFVLILWNICTFAEEGIAAFVFNVFDQDGSGRLDEEELKGMINELMGHHSQQNQAKILSSLDPPVSFPDFAPWAEERVEALLPAKVIQKMLQKRVVGEEWWVDEAAPHRATLMNQVRAQQREDMDPNAYEDMQRAKIQKKADERRKKAMMGELLSDSEDDSAGSSGSDDEYDSDEREARRARRTAKAEKIVGEFDGALQRVRAYQEYKLVKHREERNWRNKRKEKRAEGDPLDRLLLCDDPCWMRTVERELRGTWDDEERRLRAERAPSAALARMRAAVDEVDVDEMVAGMTKGTRGYDPDAGRRLRTEGDRAELIALRELRKQEAARAAAEAERRRLEAEANAPFVLPTPVRARPAPVVTKVKYAGMARKRASPSPKHAGGGKTGGKGKGKGKKGGRKMAKAQGGGHRSTPSPKKMWSPKKTLQAQRVAAYS